MLKVNPKIKILGVSGRTDEYTLYRVFMTGLFGFVDKNTESIDELKKAVEQHEQKKEEMQRKIDEARAKGNGAEAAKLQQQLNQMSIEV